jgi:SNF2 family DNA or RNA helicase
MMDSEATAAARRQGHIPEDLWARLLPFQRDGVMYALQRQVGAGAALGGPGVDSGPAGDAGAPAGVAAVRVPGAADLAPAAFLSPGPVWQGRVLLADEMGLGKTLQVGRGPRGGSHGGMACPLRPCLTTRSSKPL